MSELRCIIYTYINIPKGLQIHKLAIPSDYNPKDMIYNGKCSCLLPKTVIYHILFWSYQDNKFATLRLSIFAKHEAASEFEIIIQTRKMCNSMGKINSNSHYSVHQFTFS